MNLDKLKADIKEGNLYLTNSDICSIFKPIMRDGGILSWFLCLTCTSGCSNSGCSNANCSNSSCSNSSCYVSCASGCTGSMTS